MAKLENSKRGLTQAVCAQVKIGDQGAFKPKHPSKKRLVLGFAFVLFCQHRLATAQTMTVQVDTCLPGVVTAPALSSAPPLDAQPFPPQAPPPVIEFQLEGNAVLTMLRNRLQREIVWRLCPAVGSSNDGGFHPVEYDIPNIVPGAPANPVVLDHVEFPNDPSDPGGHPVFRQANQSISWPPGNQGNPDDASDDVPPGPFQILPLQAVIPVELFFKAPDCVKNPTCFTPTCGPDEFAFKLRIHFVLTLVAGGQSFCLERGLFEMSGIPIPDSTLPPELLAQLPNRICEPVDLEAFNQFIPPGSSVTNTGIAADPAFHRVGYRLEVNGPVWNQQAPSPSWQAFFAGQLAGGLGPPLPHASWAAFVSGSLLAENVENRFEKKLKESDEIELESGPDGEWNDLDERVVVTFSGEVNASKQFELLKVCPTFGVDVTVKVDFSVDANKPNFLKANGKLETNVDDGDVFGCAVLIGNLTPAEVRTSVLTVTGVLAANALSFTDIGEYLPGECQKTGDTEFVCLIAIDLPAVDFIGDWGHGEGALLQLDQMVNLNDGPAVGGPFTHAPFPISSGRLFLSSDGFTFGVQGGCQQDAWGTGAGPWPSIGYDCWVKAGTGRFCHNVEIVQDHFGLFRAVYGHGSPVESEPVNDFRIEFPAIADNPFSPNDPYDQYFNPQCESQPFHPACRHYRYPVRMIVRSSAGSQCLQIRPPEKGDPTEFEQDLLAAQVDCIPAGLDEEDLYIQGAFDPIWHTDPPPFDQPVQVVVDGAVAPAQWGSLQIVDLAISASAPVTGQTVQTGQYQFSGVVLDITAQAQMDPCQFIPCGGVPGSESPGGESLGDADGETLEQAGPPPVRLSIKTRHTTDLIAWRVGPGFRVAELALPRDWSLTIDLPRDQLPPGIKTATLRLSLDRARVTLVAPLRRREKRAEKPR
jgi:hypothetical protein